MTPADFRNSLARQGLTNLDFAREIGTSPFTISRWAQGHNKIPGAAQAFLELREYAKSPGSDEMRDGLELLYYCRDRGLGLIRAKRAIRELLKFRKLAPWKYQRNQSLKRRLERIGP